MEIGRLRSSYQCTFVWWEVSSWFTDGHFLLLSLQSKKENRSKLSLMSLLKRAFARWLLSSSHPDRMFFPCHGLCGWSCGLLWAEGVWADGSCWSLKSWASFCLLFLCEDSFLGVGAAPSPWNSHGHLPPVALQAYSMIIAPSQPEKLYLCFQSHWVWGCTEFFDNS